MSDSHATIFQTFCDLQVAMLDVETAWQNRRELSGLRFAIADARHHCCTAAAFLVDFEKEIDWPPTSLHDRISDVERIVAHEAYLSAVALGQMLRSALEDHMVGTDALERGLVAVALLLDTLDPFVSNTDRALRDIVIDHLPRCEPNTVLCPVSGHDVRASDTLEFALVTSQQLADGPTRAQRPPS